jgi:hypothetical protein
VQQETPEARGLEPKGVAIRVDEPHGRIRCVTRVYRDGQVEDVRPNGRDEID